MHKKLNQTPQQTYLDCLLTQMENFIKARIIKMLSRPLEEDTVELRQYWARKMSRVVVSAIIEALGKKYDKDIDNLWDQAEETLRRFAIEDFKNYSQDSIQERFGRFVEEFSEMPRYPKYKKLKPHPLRASEELEYAKEFLADISQQGNKINAENIKKRIKEKFPKISEIDIDSIVTEIENNKKALTEAVTENGHQLALVIAAKSYNVEPETFERHYLSGARKDAKTFNNLLKQEK